MDIRRLAFLLLPVCAACTDEPAGPATARGAPERVVVLSPAVAEMLGELELLDRVVGIGQFGPWPPDLAGLPVVGGYDDPNVEQVMQLRADTIINTRSQAAADAHRRLRKLGIEVVELDTSTYEGVFTSLEQLGETFGRGAGARRLIAELSTELADIERRTRGLEKKRVLFVVGRDPVFVAGPGSHPDRLIALAGGENVAHDLGAPYQQLSLEAVLERRPEVIIDTSDNRPGALRGRMAGSWKRWPFLPAVRDERIYWLDPSRLVIPGIRLPAMARLMSRLIHPEVFGEPAAEQYRRVAAADG